MLNDFNGKSFFRIKIFLNFIYYFGLVGIICFVPACLVVPNYNFVNSSLFTLIFSVAAYCCGLAIVPELIKINDTIINKTPFIIENTKRMQKIAIYLFVISVYVFTKDWLRFKAHIFAFNFDNSGLYTDAEFLIFVLLGVFVLILAKIFNMAVEIKGKNDLTI